MSAASFGAAPTGPIRKIASYVHVTDQMVTDALQDACIILFGIDPTGMSDEEMRQVIDERQREMFEKAARLWVEPASPVTPDQLPSDHPLVQRKEAT